MNAIYRRIRELFDFNATYMDKNKCSPIFKAYNYYCFFVLVMPSTEPSYNSLTFRTLNNWEF